MKYLNIFLLSLSLAISACSTCNKKEKIQCPHKKLIHQISEVQSENGVKNTLSVGLLLQKSLQIGIDANFEISDSLQFAINSKIKKTTSKEPYDAPIYSLMNAKLSALCGLFDAAYLEQDSLRRRNLLDEHKSMHTQYLKWVLSLGVNDIDNTPNTKEKKEKNKEVKKKLKPNKPKKKPDLTPAPKVTTSTFYILSPKKFYGNQIINNCNKDTITIDPKIGYLTEYKITCNSVKFQIIDKNGDIQCNSITINPTADTTQLNFSTCH